METTFNHFFDINMTYTNGDKAIYENKTWIFSPPEKLSQFTIGLIPSNENYWTVN